MVDCNVKGCEELARIQISTGTEWLHLCWEHSAKRDAGISLDLDIDFYQRFENMGREYVETEDNESE